MYNYDRNVIAEIMKYIDDNECYHYDDLIRYAVSLASDGDLVFLKVLMNYNVKRVLRDYIYVKYHVWNNI